MARSYLAVIALIVALSLGGCSLFSSGTGKPRLPVVTVRSATMDATPGIKVYTNLRLPPGFVPTADRAPLWLQNGSEVALIGDDHGRTEIYGFSGPGWRTRRLIAADGGPGARGGVILDAAANQTGLALALAVYEPEQKKLNVVVRDVIATGPGHEVTSIKGSFQSVSIGWLNPMTIVLGVSRTASGNASGNEGSKNTGLWIIGVSGMVTAEYEPVKCPLSYLVWGPGGTHAVGVGGDHMPPIVLDRHGPSCERIFPTFPIRVLSWSLGGGSFLYAQRSVDGIPGVFRYDTASHRSTLVAVSSQAAAFTASGAVLALGNSDLNFARAKRFPNRPVKAELALAHASTHQLDTVSLGFKSTPVLLAQSTMTYSAASNHAAIDTFLPTASGILRRIITYSLARQSAFIVAYGPARGLVTMSWSPGGEYLAIFDAGASGSALTILQPPR